MCVQLGFNIIFVQLSVQLHVEHHQQLQVQPD